MLCLIADLNLNSERGRQGGQERQRRRDRARGGTGDGHTQAKKFVCEKCATYSRGSLKISRDCQNGGEQRRSGRRGAAAHTHTHAHTLPNTSFNLKKAHFTGNTFSFFF